jgi:hypothetical protein
MPGLQRDRHARKREEEAAESAAEQVGAHLSSAFKQAVSGNKYLKVTTREMPQRAFRFVTKLDL